MACDVLVLDDDPFVLSLLVDFLDDEGFAVGRASSSDEALQLFDTASPPKVLVTDFNLRERQTGLDVAREFRKRAPNLPVIFITGRPDFLRNHQLDAKQRLLHKPFKLESLAASIRDLWTA